MDISCHLEVISKSLKALKENIDKSKNKEYFISEHQKDILLKDVHYKIKQELVKLFGKGCDATEFGVFNSLFKSNQSGYDSGIMLTYWSYYDVPYNSSKIDNGKWRGNLFYKGSRYSNIKLKNNFYDSFNVISDKCKNQNEESNVPVDFFVRNTKQAKENNLNFSIEPIIFLPSTSKCNIDKALKIPVKDSFIAESYLNDESKFFFNELYRFKEAKEKCGEDKDKKEKVVRDVEQLLERKMELVFEIIKQNNNTFVHDFLNQIAKIFPQITIENSLYDIFKLIVCYQFYDHDGITYLYFPQNINKSLSCLGLLIPFTNSAKIDFYENNFKQIIDALSNLPIYEKEVFDIAKDNIISKNVWKAYYLSRIPMYESLCQHFSTLLKFICRNKKIKISDITFRIKTFDSFYNRAVDRFNNPDSFHIPKEDVKYYRECFLLGGSKDKIDNVFSKFWDIGGIRILCVFKDGLDLIFKELCDNQLKTKLNKIKKPYVNNKYQIKVNFIDKKSLNDYRGEHYILKLANERINHPEMEELKGISCEVQVKTMLSQGWSDADHDLLYKSDLPLTQQRSLLPEEEQLVGKTRSQASRQLDEVDEKFLLMRNAIKKILDEFED